MVRHKNLVLKALIVLGFFAIIASSYVQYGIPYLEEQGKEANDQERIADLDALKTSLEAALARDSGAYKGQSNTVYVSLSSGNPECENFDLPSLPEGWRYHCTSMIQLLNANGTGWLPIDLTRGSSQTPPLPLDPINDANTLTYYAFVASSTPATKTASSTTQFVLTAVLDSKKYLTEKAQTDGGSDPIRYEVGYLPKLWSDANGLLGYWPFDEHSGSTVHDLSGNNVNGTVIGTPLWQEKGIRFDGKNFAVFNSTPEVNSIGNQNSSYSLIFWLKNVQNIDQSLSEKWDRSPKYPWAFRVENGYITFAVYNGEIWKAATTRLPVLNTDDWMQVIAVKDGEKSELRLYANGTLVAQTALDGDSDVSNKDGFTIGSRNSRGDSSAQSSISHVALYEKALRDTDAGSLFSKIKHGLFDEPK